MASSPANPHAAARLALARRIEAAHSQKPMAVVIASGLTGRGTAGEHSDLELDFYWREPPTAAERRAAVAAGGAEAAALHGVIADVFDLVDRHVAGFNMALDRARMQRRRPKLNA
ncbi:MAG: hypothetical protein IT318_27440 [Anaerolineales bacterium]|nr:hypothetical protein [Anaerolineales bacterium]